jgi:sulfotransferase family protein
MRLAALAPSRLTASRRFKRNVAGVAEPPFPVPFICGATRSGTTLLRLMLDSHPQVAIPGETHFVVPMIKISWRRARSADELATLIVESDRWGDFHLDEDELRVRLRALDPLNCADAIREFFRLYAEKQGKQRWGDKTPGYVRSMRLIQKVLPEARFVHIIRDGRDVALSLVPRTWGPSTFPEAAENWRRRIDVARRQQPHLDHYLEVHYEDLITDTEGVLRRVAEFLELDFDPAMLRYHERAGERLAEKARDLEKPWGTISAASRIESHALAESPPQADRVALWRTQMTEADRIAYEAIAGDALVAAGYELGGEGSDPRRADSASHAVGDLSR